MVYELLDQSDPSYKVDFTSEPIAEKDKIVASPESLLTGLDYLSRLEDRLEAPLYVLGEMVNHRAEAVEYRTNLNVSKTLQNEDLVIVMNEVMDSIVQDLKYFTNGDVDFELEEYKVLMLSFFEGKNLSHLLKKEYEQLSHMFNRLNHLTIIFGRSIVRRNQKIIDSNPVLSGLRPDEFVDQSQKVAAFVREVGSKDVPRIDEVLEWWGDKFGKYVKNAVEGEESSRIMLRARYQTIALLEVIRSDLQNLTNDIPNDLTLRLDKIILSFQRDILSLGNTGYKEMGKDLPQEGVTLKDLMDELKKVRTGLVQYLKKIDQGYIKIDPNYGNLHYTGKKLEHRKYL